MTKANYYPKPKLSQAPPINVDAIVKNNKKVEKVWKSMKKKAAAGESYTEKQLGMVLSYVESQLLHESEETGQEYIVMATADNLAADPILARRLCV